VIVDVCWFFGSWSNVVVVWGVVEELVGDVGIDYW